MDFALTDEHRLMVETARRVGEKFGLDYWRERDAAHEFAADFWRAVCQAGLGSVALPAEHGGSGLGMIELALVIEELAAGGGGSTVGQVFMNNPIFGGTAISRFGSDRMKRELLPKLASGDMRFCMALTEPDAGTNSLNIETFARGNGSEGWLLNGRKIWITGVPQADKMLVVARTTRLEAVRRKTDGISMFLIDVDRPGLVHQAIDKLGTRTNPSSMVFFDDVEVAADELIGTLDQGWHELLHVLNTERIVTTAALAGTGRLAARLAVDYARTRSVFNGVPIGSYQGLQFPLAQAHAELQCARVMNLRAAWLHDTGQPYGSESNMAKLIAAQATMTLAERAMQTMGGMGYATEMHVERLWRDARLFKFAPVSEEMILNFIAQHDLGLPRSY
jgi:acyl-CoA dehydrogenase